MSYLQKEASLRPPSADGRLSTSSGHSSFDVDLPHHDSARIFNIYHTSSHTNWTVTYSDKAPLYYIRTSSFRPGRPEITVHAQGSRDGPTVAVSNFRKLDSDSKLGLGDPDNAYNMIWEDLEKTSKDHSAYQFGMLVYPNDNMGPSPRRKQFSWRRTHSVGVEDSKPSKLSIMNFKLVDIETGDLVAVWANNGAKSFKKLAKIQINKNYGEEFDLMIFLSISTIIERARRRSNARRSAASGGGGGNGG